MAIILIPHQPIDFTYKENSPCENLSDMCLQYETGDNPMFQVKADNGSVPLVTIQGTGGTELDEIDIPIISQGNGYFTYQINFTELGITEGCFEVCVYEATGANLVTNGMFTSDLSGWSAIDGLQLGINSFSYPVDCDGSVELEVTGGIPSYTYSMDGVIYQISNNFFDLCGGIPYTFWVKDSNGIIDSIPFTFRDCSSYEGSEAFDVKNIYAFEITGCEAFNFV